MARLPRVYERESPSLIVKNEFRNTRESGVQGQSLVSSLEALGLWFGLVLA